MHVARELVTSNGMSTPAWAFFTTLITIVGAILRELIKTRNTTIARLDRLEDAVLYLMQNDTQNGQTSPRRRTPKARGR